MAKLVRKFRKEREYDEDRNKNAMHERRKKQKQTQNVKRMAFFEPYAEDSLQDFTPGRK